MTKPIVIGLILAFCLTTSTVKGQEAAPAPAFKDGDTWQINYARANQVGSSTDDLQGTYEITFVQGNVKVVEVNGNQKSDVAIQPDGPTQSLINWIGKSTQQDDLRFPLSVGQKWSYEYTTSTGRNPQRRSAEVAVVGIEQVTTPAGSFKAFKLVKTQSWSTGPRGGRGGNTRTYFYSPETKSVVKSSSTNDNTTSTVQAELVKFTPGN